MIRGSMLIVAMATLALGCLGGCASQLDRIETGLQVNRDAISQLEAENARTQQEVQALAAVVRMQQAAGDETGAMKMAKLTQFSARLDQLLQKLDDNAEFMRRLSARVDLLVTRSGIPTLGEYRPPPVNEQQSVELPEEGRTILEAADLDRSRGNTDLARAGYEEFLSRFGASEAATEAMFRLGDLELGAGEPQKALQHFDALLKRSPQGPRSAASLYKSRQCLLALDRKEEAVERGRRLLADFPGSPEADLLEEEMKSSQ